MEGAGKKKRSDWTKAPGRLAPKIWKTLFNTLCAASGYFSLKIHKYAAESAPPTG